MSDLQPFFLLISSLTEVFQEMIVLESNKLDAIAVNDIEKLEQYMKEEQAYAMKMRGLDGKREALQKSMGFENLTLREVIARLDPAEAERLAEMDGLLRTMIEELKNAVSCTKKYIELHLCSLQMLLDQANESKSSETYDNKGEKQPPDAAPKKFAPKKI